jgi:membrane-associated phospholipid phosphatase
MHFLLEWDWAAFRAVNSGLSHPILDWVLPLCRERLIWLPLYAFVLTFVALHWPRRRAWLIVLGLALSVGAADVTSSVFLKKNVQRLRPCNDPALREQVVLRLPHCGSGYSFTSSHAANHFAVAVFLGGVLGPIRRWIRPVLLAWASLIAFAQVYVGVHFPLDVLCGAVVGWLAASAVLRGLRRVLSRM